MILFENGLIKLDYTPATDVLEVAYPDLHDFLLHEIKHCIDVLIENIINYDVKRVLLNSSLTVVAVSEQQSREITSYLIAGLMKTRLQKLARVQSASADVEALAQNNIKYVQETGMLPFELNNFLSKAEAISWLTNNHT